RTVFGGDQSFGGLLLRLRVKRSEIDPAAVLWSRASQVQESATVGKKRRVIVLVISARPVDHRERNGLAAGRGHSKEAATAAIAARRIGAEDDGSVRVPVGADLAHSRHDDDGIATLDDIDSEKTTLCGKAEPATVVGPKEGDRRDVLGPRHLSRLER